MVFSGSLLFVIVDSQNATARMPGLQLCVCMYETGNTGVNSAGVDLVCNVNNVAPQRFVYSSKSICLLQCST